MKTTQVIQIDKAELLTSIQELVLSLAKEISILYAQDENELNIYDKYEFNEAFSTLKKKERAFYAGKASMLLKVVEEMNVYIDKRAFQFIAHLSKQG